MSDLDSTCFSALWPLWAGDCQAWRMLRAWGFSIGARIWPDRAISLWSSRRDLAIDASACFLASCSKGLIGYASIKNSMRICCSQHQHVSYSWRAQIARQVWQSAKRGSTRLPVGRHIDHLHRLTTPECCKSCAPSWSNSGWDWSRGPRTCNEHLGSHV